MENNSSNTLDENKKPKEANKKRKRKRIKLFIFAGIIACGLYGGWYVYTNRSYNDFEVIDTSVSLETLESEYELYNNQLIKYSNDGISYIDSKGKAIWTESFSMKSPKVVVQDDYIAAANLNGNEVYLFNSTGKVDNFSTPYPICDIELAGQGVIAVVLEDKKTNHIILYDKTGKELAASQNSIEQSGYPLDIALSDDGTKLIASYIKMDGVTVNNNVAFFNFASYGQNQVNRIVGGKDFGSTIVPKVEFLDNDNICLYGDDKIVIMEMKQRPKEKATIKLTTEIQSIFSSDKYIGIVSTNSNNKDNNKYIIKVYNTSGKEVLSLKTNKDYNKIRFDKNNIMIIGDYECTIFNMMGNQIFHGNFGKNIVDVIPNGKSREYIVIGPSETQIIKLK